MGQKVPPVEIEYGDDCLRGWAAGKTPKYLYARFSEITKCPVGTVYPPNGWVFKCKQDPDHACLWTHTVNNFRMIIDVEFNPPAAILWLELLPVGRVYFWDTNVWPIVEGQVYHNNIINCLGGDHAAGGVCVITWTPQATKLLEDLNIERSEGLFMELFPLSDGKLVYKFCRIAESTNIKVLLEPE